jgi:hypothetical protein
MESIESLVICRHRSRWRPVAGRVALDRLQAEVLPARAAKGTLLNARGLPLDADRLAKAKDGVAKQPVSGPG